VTVAIAKDLSTVPSLDGTLTQLDEVSEGVKSQRESGSGFRQSEDGTNDQEQETTPSMESIVYQVERNLTIPVSSLDDTSTQPTKTSKAMESCKDSGGSRQCRKGSDMSTGSKNGQEPNITPPMEDIRYYFNGESRMDERAQSLTMDDIGRTFGGLGVFSAESPQTYTGRKVEATDRPTLKRATSMKSFQSGNDKQQEADTTIESAGVGHSSIMTDIENMLYVLSQSWHAIQQKFQDQPPPDNTPVFCIAYMKAMAANAKLLGLSPTEFCARFETKKGGTHTVPGVSSADLEKGSSVGSAVPSLSIG
jgi:hypothetical protein